MTTKVHNEKEMREATAAHPKSVKELQRYELPPLPQPMNGVPFTYSPEQIEAYGRACFRVAREIDSHHPAARAGAEPVAERPRMSFSLGEAKQLLAFFGGENCEVAVAEWTAGDIVNEDGTKAPGGKYAWCVEYPEEGAHWIGEHDCDTEEAARPAPVAESVSAEPVAILSRDDTRAAPTFHVDVMDKTLPHGTKFYLHPQPSTPGAVSDEWSPTIDDMPEGICVAKRIHVERSRHMDNWFVGFGKDESCQIEGTANHWYWLAYALLGLVDEKDSPYSEDKPLPFSPAYIRAALESFAKRSAEAKCGCGLATCVEPWEPGCGLGTSKEHAVRVDAASSGRDAAHCENCGAQEAKGGGNG